MPGQGSVPIRPDSLASLASEYSQDMTSIRGRRVQRLLKREFAGADYVLLVRAASGASAVLGVSESGAAFCATNGRGKHASVLRWRHDSAAALESRYDLLKDSLPLLGSGSVPLDGPRQGAELCVPAGFVPPRARTLVALAIQAVPSSAIAAHFDVRPHQPATESLDRGE